MAKRSLLSGRPSYYYRSLHKMMQPNTAMQ